MLIVAVYLLMAWILKFFGFDTIVIEGFKEFFDIDISIYGYYFIFALISFIRLILYREKE